MLGQSEKVEAGRETYNQYCLICHGHEMVSPGGGAYDLRKFPKEQRERFNQSVLNGRPPGMPSWKAQLGQKEIEELWSFLLSGGDPSRPATGGR